MKRITIAVDSFKGSLSSREVADAFEDGFRTRSPDCEVRKVSIADGGEGTVDALVETLNGDYVEARVADPLGRPIVARYGVIDGGTTAVMEMSAASGLPLIAPEERNPLLTSTYGTGEMIAHAMERGCRKFLVGIGGSATNDGGTGALSALGYRFLDKDGNALDGVGENLSKINSIDATNAVDISGVQFTLLCDVSNPLLGEKGATYTYGKQKGATQEEPVFLRS